MIGTTWLLMELALYNIGPWLLTYLIHSSFILGLAWATSGTFRLAPSWEACLWRTAMVGGIVTSSIRLAVGEVGGGGWLIEGVAVMSGSFGVIGAALATAWFILVPIRLHGWQRARRRLLGSIGSRCAVVDASLVEMSDDIARELGLSGGRIRLTRAPGIQSPVAVGRKEVCLPVRGFEELDSSQRRSVLAHEISHLAFHDPLWRMVGQLVRVGLFLQPLNRMAIRRLKEAAEFRADDVAARSTGSQLPLVEALFAFAKRARKGSELDGSIGFASLLTRRVDRLYRGVPLREVATGRGRVALAAILLVSTLAVPGVDPPCDCRIRAAWAELSTPDPKPGAEAPVDAIADGGSDPATVSSR